MNDSEVRVDELKNLIERIFTSLDVPGKDARLLADSLVTADLEGVASHGVVLVPMYVERLKAGSVAAAGTPGIAEDLGGLVVVDAAHAFGQVSSQYAVDLALERARTHGVAAVAVRNAFHFGAAAYWTRQFAQAGMVGFAFSNTRPLMPAPGGAERVVGNNPLSIGFPSAAGKPLVVDMATSASAMGKIRVAASEARAIPEGWATDAQGAPTTSAQEAIQGMLLPAAGPKGFGLAVAIDLLCGGLSGGGMGAGVRPLYDQLDQPYNCAHAFIAIDAARTGGGAGMGAQVDRCADTIRGSRRAPGVDRLYAPGDLENARRLARGATCPLPAGMAETLDKLARDVGASPGGPTLRGTRVP